MTEAKAVHIWLVLFKAAKTMEAHAQKSVESLGIGRSDFGVLEALLHKGPLPVNALGEKVLLTSGSITTAVDRLERRGLVERRNSPHDRRIRLVCLTNEGTKLIRKLFAAHERDLELAVSALTETERAVLARLLKKLGSSAQSLLQN